MNRILIYYTICCLLLGRLYYLELHKVNFSETPPSIIYRWLETRIENNFQQKSKGVMLYKLVTGGGPSLHYTIKKPFEDLYLYSLISFNGLHLYLMLTMLRLNRQKRIRNALTLMAFSSAHSPSILKSFLMQLKFFFPRLKNFRSIHLFYGIQLIIGIFAYLNQQDFSFIFCFIFGGFYFFMRTFSKSKQLWHLAIIQLLISIALNKSFSILGLLISIIIVYLFTKLYMFLFLLLIVSLTGHYLWVNTLVSFSFTLLKNVALISSSFKIQSCLFLLLTMFGTKLTKAKWPWLIYALLSSGIAFTPIIHYSK